MFRSSNPAFTSDAFSDSFARSSAGANTMTVQGTAIKTCVLVLLAAVTATFAWSQVIPADKLAPPNQQAAMLWGIGGMVSSLIFSLIIIFSPKQAPWAAPIYALCEGLLLGALSAFVQSRFATTAPGIVMQALMLTFGTLFAMMTAYNLGIIKATEKFKTGMYAAIGAIALLYLASFVMRLFGMEMPYLHGSGPIGIGISVIIVIVAALSLILDFDFIETAAERGAPKYFEWYGAFGLLVTLAWLYIEILRLLAKLNSRD